MKTMDQANELRKIIIEMANKSQSAHVGSALSCVDILAVLYHKILRLSNWDERDIFILSKGQAAMALYAALYQKGIIEKKHIDSYYLDGGFLPGHLDRFSVPGVEVSAGSLGHGFNIGLGVAYAYKQKKIDRHVYIVLGDGESQEGSIWEGAMFSADLGLDNLTVIMDYNNLQGYGRAKEICHFEPVRDKWEAFGWSVIEVDGHDHAQLEIALRAEYSGKPKIIIAKTVKGKGVSFMEDQLVWHYYMVTDEIKEKAFLELSETVLS